RSTGSRPKDASPTATLGLARLSSWRVKVFGEAVVKVMEEMGGKAPALRVEPMVHGGERVSDVWAVFEDAVEADVVRELIQGVVVAGRRLQVSFAG
ncbi:hypothetical protein Tdes44962_MAKER10462, partial [Teratosphaeria destructans]